jgi:hypothetical protein
MTTTDLPSLIREYVDGGASPITFGEIETRAAMREPAVRSVPIRHRPRLGIAAIGVVAAGIAGALVASQLGGTAAGDRAVLTAAVLKQMAGASQAAMTSGRADIDWTGSNGWAGSSSPSVVVQQISFDGGNSNDVMYTSGQEETIERIVDGAAYQYPAFVMKPKPHWAPGWMRASSSGNSLQIPDPRVLLSVLSPSAGIVRGGYTTVDGVRVQELRATTPGAVPLGPLDQIIDGEPASPVLSALELWVNSSGVVLKAWMVITGNDRAAASAQAGKHPNTGTVTVTVTFSQIGQPQSITAPAHYTTVGGQPHRSSSKRRQLITIKRS